MDHWFSVRCAWCGELFDIELDPSAARHQRYVEDCFVCCRPNVIQVVFDEQGGAEVTTEQE